MKENLLNLVFTENYDSLYWAYNCPLQMWPVRQDIDNEDSPIDGYRVINYMPRKERCSDMGEIIPMNEIPNFCKNAAIILRNLANLFEALAEKKIETIYYPDEIVTTADLRNI